MSLAAMSRRAASLGAVMLFCSAGTTGLARAAERITPRIVGGDPVEITTYPFQVALYHPSGGAPQSSQFCGGVILDATHVATAAHCVFNQATGRVTAPSSLRVLAGTKHLRSAMETYGVEVKDVPVAATSFHPFHNPATNDYDVAILTLDPASALYTGSPALDGTTNIAPVPPITPAQADSFANPVLNSSVYVSGWGDTNYQPVNGQNATAFPDDLRAVQTHLVTDAYCQARYRTTPRMICAGEPGGLKDSCSGDSGGPLVASPSSPPANDALVGIVSFGSGCAVAGSPGVYARVASPELSGFLTSSPPQAPQLAFGPGLTGTPSPGQTLSCASGIWTSGPGFLYRFARDLGGGYATSLTQLSGSNTYVVQAGDAGTNIFCRVRAINAGGYGEADSSDVSVPGAAAPAPSPPAATPSLVAPQDKRSPSASIAAKSCSRGRCTVNVRVIDPIPTSGIRALQATLSWKTKAGCRRGGRRTTCTRTHTRHPTVKAIGGGHFLVSAGHLKRGSYTLSVLPVDKAGNRPRRATVVALKLR